MTAAGDLWKGGGMTNRQDVNALVTECFEGPLALARTPTSKAKA